MSGFAGIVHWSGNPVVKNSLEKMAQRIARHGGDTANTLAGDNFGFVHSTLFTTPESLKERQPLSIDDKTWVVGDARIDARDELIDALKKTGRTCEPGTPDINLVFLAYSAWGVNCVRHLLGDFSFAVWDSTKRILFCARDHFGIKPFYFFRDSEQLVFSNDLNAVRTCSKVSDKLNEDALGDYFAFGYNLDEATTCFQNIKRIPPGHTLTVHKDRKRLENYRQINTSKHIHYTQESEYADHFLDLFSRAVKDRLRSDNISFELSGGLDSTSVAALASHLRKGDEGFSGLGITTDSSHLFPDVEEAHFASMVADSCGIRHCQVKAGMKEDFYTYCDTAQPYAWPFAATSRKFANVIKQHSNVLLGGQFGDVLFQGSGVQVRDEFREASLARFIKNRLQAMVKKRSYRAMGIRSLIDQDRPLLELPTVPEWLRADMIKKSGSEERWRNLFYRGKRFPAGCRSEMTWDVMRMPFWSHLFESYYHDLLCGIDCRQPFMDLRLLEFAFSIPASVKISKRLLRRSMSELLPKAVLDRPKTNVSSDIVKNALCDPSIQAKLPERFARSRPWVHEGQYKSALREYIQSGDENPFTILGPLGFERWNY